MADADSILAALVEWLESQDVHNGIVPYADCRDPKDACLDGWFDLRELAEHIASKIDSRADKTVSNKSLV